MVGAQGHSGSVPAGSGKALLQRQGQAPGRWGRAEESGSLKTGSFLSLLSL